MRAARVLRSAINDLPVKMTLFTRANCSLCDNAKLIVQKALKPAEDTGKSSGPPSRYVFEYNELDVMKKGNEMWKQAYEFDVPVLHIYNKKEKGPEPDRMEDAQKLMHRFSEKEVQDLVAKTSENRGGEAEHGLA